MSLDFLQHPDTWSFLFCVALSYGGALASVWAVEIMTRRPDTRQRGQR